MFDPKTGENYDCKNEYEFKIKSFTQKQQFNFFDDEVIEYALSLKKELINELGAVWLLLFKRFESVAVEFNRKKIN